MVNPFDMRTMVPYALPYPHHTLSYPGTEYSGASSSSAQAPFSNPLINCDFRSSYCSPYVAQPTTTKRKRDNHQYAPTEHNAAHERAIIKLSRAARKEREVVLRKEYAPELYVGSGRSCDDHEGHYIIVNHSELTHRYTIDKLLGQGTFGKVVRAYDRHKRTYVAIKIIRAIQKYRDASMIELRVLRTLQENDPRNSKSCIHLRDCFDFRNHVCIVTELLNESIFDFLKGNHFAPFPNHHIRHFAKQLFTSVAFLHDLDLIHTDLKPENILLVSNESSIEQYYGRTNHSTRKVLHDTNLRLIDFGSATFSDEYHSNVVSTRHYRAPEIILGMGWSFPCDIWSIGCILIEFHTGDALYQTHDNLEHLAMMELVCGRIDGKIIRQCSKAAQKMFRPTGRLDYPTRETSRDSRKFVKNMKSLGEMLPPTSEFNNAFCDLLQRIFRYDPATRITAHEALHHPFFQQQ